MSLQIGEFADEAEPSKPQGLKNPQPGFDLKDSPTWLEMQRQDRSPEGRGSLHSSASGTLPEDKQDTPRYCFPMPEALHSSVALSITLSPAVTPTSYMPSPHAGS